MAWHLHLQQPAVPAIYRWDLGQRACQSIVTFQILRCYVLSLQQCKRAATRGWACWAMN